MIYFHLDGGFDEKFRLHRVKINIRKRLADRKMSEYIDFNPERPLHAYLLISNGVGALRDFVGYVTRALMCESLTPQGEPCGKCSACVKVLSETHPDVSFLGRDKVSVDDVREIRQKAYLSPNEGKRKIFVLENIELFNDQSQNALLKILEEPPKDVVFLLTASSKSKILQTVLSRVCVLTDNRTDESFLIKTVDKLLKDNADEEIKRLFYAYFLAYEDADPDTVNVQLVTDAYKIALEFFKGTDTVIVTKIPKKREEALVFFKVLMLVAKSIAMYKLTMGKMYGNNSESSIFSDEFRKICVRYSAKRAVTYYELFEKAYAMTEDYANTNALLAYLSQNM